MGILDCDDGNDIDGDGCSSQCQIESDFKCEGGSTDTKDVCYNNRPPELLHSINEENVVMITFSKEVLIETGIFNKLFSSYRCFG